MRIPLIESVIWTLVVILVIVIFILVIYLKVLRRNIRITVKRNIKYTNIVEQMLIEFLYSNEEGDGFSKNQKAIIKKFKKGLPSKRKRKIIIETFIKLGQEISGNMVFTMYNLYEEIGLLKFTVKKLRSKKWNIVALGIRDLRQFRVKRTQHLITKFVNHKREEVRREAHLYFLELFGYKGLSFLDNLKLPLSEWDQIQLLGEVQRIENNEILDGEKVIEWLQSENDYVVIFVLRIVKFFNRLETKEILLNLINHSNIEIRLKVIEILTHFEIYEAKEIIKNKLQDLSIKEKIAFFKYLEKTATKEDSLLVLDYINHENFELKYKALAILKSIDENLYKKLEKTSEDESYNKIIQFLDYSYGI